MVRVALNVEQLLYPSPGGIGRYTRQLVAGLGADVVAFCARHDRAEVRATMAQAGLGGCQPTILPLRRPVLYEAWHRFGLPPLGLDDVDLIHAPSVAVPPKRGLPLVVTVHDAAPALFPDTFPKRGLRFHRLGLAAAARRADLVIAVSHAAATELARHAAIPDERIRVVPNGVEPPPAAPERWAAARHRLGLDERPYVLWVGSLEPRKNVRTLVAAMARILGRWGRVDDRPRLVLAGYPGWLTDVAVDAGDLADLGDDLLQVGQVGEDELWALYGGATLFAFPSRHEGFGYPVLEAMSQGVPVACSDIPVLREVAGSAAEYAAARDAGSWADLIAGLLADEGLRQTMGEAGRAQAAAFGVDAMVAATRDVYREAVGAGPSG